MKNNIKEIKTTVIGILLILLGIAVIFIPTGIDIPIWLIIVFIFSGSMLLISPDKYINILLSKFKKKKL